MKRILSFIICVSILLQTNSVAVVLADFYLRRDYIAKNLCENRDKPQMKCCGKCYLKKKLAKEAKEQAPTSRNQKNVEVVTLFCTYPQFHIVCFQPIEILKEYFNRDETSLHTYYHTVFHPPTA